MSQERKRVLQLLAEGKITPEQADRLLEALEEGWQPGGEETVEEIREAAAQARAQSGQPVAGEALDEMKSAVEEVKRTVEEAVHMATSEETVAELRRAAAEAKRAAEEAARAAISEETVEELRRAAEETRRAAEQAARAALNEQTISEVTRAVDEAMRAASQEIERAVAEATQQLQQGASGSESWMSWIERVASFLGMGVKYSEQQEWTLDGVGVTAVHAETSNGAISLEGHDEPQVVVRAWKEVRGPNEAAARAFAEQVQIHVERQGNEVHIRKEHPRPPLGTAVTVHYEIRSPRAARAVLHTSNGKVQAHGLAAAIEAQTSNGAIEVTGGDGLIDLRTSNGKITLLEGRGQVQAHTNNGAIEATIVRLEKGGEFVTSNGSIQLTVKSGACPIETITSNGSIQLALPTDFNGRLEAHTTNGRVHCELAITVQESSRTHLIGQLGAGGETSVKARTSNGSIHIGSAARA